MYQTIKNHLKICIGMKRNCMDWKLLELYQEQELLEFLNEVSGINMGEQVQKLQSETVGKLIRDVGFCQILQWLTQEGIELKRIQCFLKKFPGDNPSFCEYATLKKVLEDQEVPDEYVYEYWAHFMQYHLEPEQKESLWHGLRVFTNIHQEGLLCDLREEERKILWEPGFCERIFWYASDIGMILKYLQDRELMELINQLAVWMPQNNTMKEKQFRQLADSARELGGMLEDIMQQIPSESQEAFLNQWMTNENLLYDLRKLSGAIPGMKEEQIQEISRSRVAYVNQVYGKRLAGMDLDGLGIQKENLLIYAITHKKRHFLSLVEGNQELFQALPQRSILLDERFYHSYVNLNTLKQKNLSDCMTLEAFTKWKSAFMEKEDYTFEEIRQLCGQKDRYIQLYHLLEYERVDDRLRVFREITKKQCIPGDISKEELQTLGKYLSKKTLSSWMQNEFCRIKNLNAETCIRILAHKEELERFLPDIDSQHQISCILRNRDHLGEFQHMDGFKRNILEKDSAWLEIRKLFALENGFVEEHKERILKFLYQDGAGILSAFCHNNENCKESARRLFIAEAMGQFQRVKYDKDDLAKEIDYPVTDIQKTLWIENETLTAGDGFTAWEEDRLLPVMQIGEIPTTTCLSYDSGAQKECLLSCFDANKKVLFISKHGKITFRAILRLTKGKCGNLDDGDGQQEGTIEFVDLLKEQAKEKQAKSGEGQKEKLILFLERPYECGMSPKELETAIHTAIELAERKAEKLGAELVMSHVYGKYLLAGKNEKGYVWSNYYVYISKSKNGRQYLDSLGGKAKVTDSGSFRKSSFVVREKLGCSINVIKVLSS